MRHLFILVLLLTIITLNSVSAAPAFGKDEVKVESVYNNSIIVNIGEDMEEPLAIYLFDKKTGEQLNYKYWKPGRKRTVNYDVSNYHTKSYTIIVKLKGGETIYKKSVH